MAEGQARYALVLEADSWLATLIHERFSDLLEAPANGQCPWGGAASAECQRRLAGGALIILGRLLRVLATDCPQACQRKVVEVSDQLFFRHLQD